MNKKWCLTPKPPPCAPSLKGAAQRPLCPAYAKPCSLLAVHEENLSLPLGLLDMMNTEDCLTLLAAMENVNRRIEDVVL